jgi:hypothetical protein
MLNPKWEISMFWYIIGYIVIGFIGGSLYWGMFNEVKYSQFYNDWYNSESVALVIVLSAIWPFVLFFLLIIGIWKLICYVFEIISNIGYNITH